VINQSDVVERTQQVKNMHDIYANSKTTNLWLGEGAPAVSAAIKLVLLAANAYDKPKDGDTRNPDITTVAAAYLEIARLEYWTRVWIQQELVSSKDIVVLCGDMSMPFGRFHAYVRGFIPIISQYYINYSISTYGHDDMEMTRYVNQAESLITPFIVDRLDKPLNLQTWLEEFCGRKKCTDPRDIVFGFYSQLVLEEKAMLTVDYTRGIAEVFAEVVGAFLKVHGNLRILGSGECFTRDAQESLDLPSWVPNFAGRDGGKYPFADLHNHDTEFISYFHEILPDGKILRVRGVELGTCSSASAPFTSRKESNGNSETTPAIILDHYKNCTDALGVLSERPDIPPKIASFTQQDLETFTSVFVGPGIRSLDAEEAVYKHLGLRYNSGRLLDVDQDSSLADEKQEFQHLSQLHHERAMFSMKPSKAPQDIQFITALPIWYGIGPNNIRAGNKVYYLGGLSTPVVLRSQDGWYRLLGCAYMPELSAWPCLSIKRIVSAGDVEDVYLCWQERFSLDEGQEREPV
jgi:hypothetical protein